MAKHVFAVMGATGHIGHVVVEELLKRGHEVHAMGRNREKLDALRTAGAKVFPVAFDTATGLAEAFHGADGIFTMIPPAYEVDDFPAFQDRVGEATFEAIKKSGVQRIVDLSSLGADLKEGTGPILGLHRHEVRLSGLKQAHVLHLRPCFFMDNLFAGIPRIMQHGVYGSMLRGESPIHMVASRDVGLKAADLLERMEFKGQTVFEFVGPRMVTLNEVTAVLGKAISQPELKYVQVPYGEMERGMLATGMKPMMVRLMIDMNRAFNEGRMVLHHPINRDHQGRTSIEDFAKTFAQAYAKS